MNTKYLIRPLVAVAALAVATLSYGQNVTGAGASFPAPIYSKWADAYNKATKIQVNYQSVGSGAGIKQIIAKTVDFGATDKPLTDEELAKDGLMQFPTVIGGVVPVVNIKGITPGQLRMTGLLLGDIYLGKITKWNDPAIKAINKDVPLPDAQIAVVRRADGSGTSFLFTNYLSKVNPDWKSRVGEGTAVNWPTGTGGKGNEGVSAFVQRLENSIGYVEYAYAKQNKMSHILIGNKEGKFVAPDDDAFKAAAAGADWAKSFYQVLTEQPTFFLRVGDSQVGHGQAIVRPKESSQLDFEAEIAIIIGKPGRRIAEADAWGHIAGYSCYNDGSVRDWQRHTSQWAPGKNFWRTGGFGPWMVTADEIPARTVMTLVSRLNGQEMQRATTEMMIHSIERQIAYASTVAPLQAGDVIVTGTPGGVGARREPPVWMKPGDVIEIEVDRIGVLRNTVTDEG